MTTRTSKNNNLPYKKGRLWWKVHTTSGGEVRLIAIKENNPKKVQGGTMLVTMTSKMIQNDKVKEAVDKVSKAGGNVVVVKNRRMEIDVEGDDVETVGDVLDSFGCQWDLQ